MPLPSPHRLPGASQALLLERRDVDTCWGPGVTTQPVPTVHNMHVAGSNRVQVDYNS